MRRERDVDFRTVKVVLPWGSTRQQYDTGQERLALAADQYVLSVAIDSQGFVALPGNSDSVDATIDNGARKRRDRQIQNARWTYESVGKCKSSSSLRRPRPCTPESDEPMNDLANGSVTLIVGR